MEAAVVWTWRVPGDFWGTGLVAFPHGAVLSFHDSAAERVVLQALDLGGDSAWRADWKGMTSLTAEADFVWIGGRTVRVANALTGALVAEKALESTTNILAPGVIYVGSYAEGRIVGLSRNLVTLWEWKEDAPNYQLASSEVLGRWGADRLDLVSIPSLARREFRVDVPAVLGPMVLVGGVVAKLSMGPGTSVAVEATTGEVVWRRDDPEGFGLAQRWGAVVISSGRGLRGVDVATGNLVWQRRLEAPVVNAVRVVGDHGYFGTEDGLIHVIDCATGRSLYERALPYRPTGMGFEPSPVLPMGDRFLVVGTRENIFCLDLGN